MGCVTGARLPAGPARLAESCEPLISEAMPCFARAVLTVNEQFFEGVDMAGESDRHDCWIISGSYEPGVLLMKGHNEESI